MDEARTDETEVVLAPDGTEGMALLWAIAYEKYTLFFRGGGMVK